MKEKVVRIECENQSGSGVVYEQDEEQVIIVTAAHVVEGAESARIEQADITEIFRVTGLDLAFLKVPDAETVEAVRDNWEEEAHTENHSNFSVHSLQGYDQNGAFIECFGVQEQEWIYVEDFKSHMLILNADAVPGMSGGGVFDKSGRFCGIICGIDDFGKVAVLPAEVVEYEYDALFRNQ